MGIVQPPPTEHGFADEDISFLKNENLELKTENENLKNALEEANEKYYNLLLDYSATYSDTDLPFTEDETITEEILKKLDARHAKKFSKKIFIWSVAFVTLVSILLYI
jgi:hypothetical protein